MKTYHYEIHLNWVGIGWFLAGYRDSLSEAEQYRETLLQSEKSMFIRNSKIKRKRNK